MRRLLALALALFALSAPAAATNTTTTVNVSATAQSSCSASTSTIAFGSFSAVMTAVVNAIGTLSVTCSNSSPYTVALSTGANSATFAGRKMVNGSNSLPYQIYTTNAYATVWGDGTASTSTVGGTGTGTAQNLSLYAQIPIATPVPAVYTDTVTATISY